MLEVEVNNKSKVSVTKVVSELWPDAQINKDLILKINCNLDKFYIGIPDSGCNILRQVILLCDQIKAYDNKANPIITIICATIY
jgi:hypothetical protein